MEIKVLCNCGQKFKFDVEPVNGKMPFAVNCPVCGTDGTTTANAILAQTLPISPTASPAIPVAARVQVRQPVATAAPAGATPPPIAMGTPASVRVAASSRKAAGEFNMGLGILGALLGAVLGAGAMYGFYQWAGFRFPLLGVGIGVLTGFGAKLLSRGTDNTLGAISGGIAMLAVIATLYLMYGEFPIISIISVVISVSMAYRIASG
jgi:hypothetical protein